MVKDNRFLLMALMLAGSAVALGAFGAHGLAKVLDAKQLSTFDTAVRYQMYHGLGLLIISMTGQAFHPTLWRQGQWLMLIGTVFFSVSLYVYIATSITTFAMVTPLGGSAMIMGWLWLIVAAWKGNQGDKTPC